MNISLIIPVFNAESFLPNLFSSINKQSYRDFEIIFVNDGSLDNTRDAVKNFIDDYEGDAKIINITNSGSNPARLIGVQNAKYNFVMFADADDIFDDNYILSFVMNYDDNIDILSSSCYIVNNGMIHKENVASDAPVVIGRNHNMILKRLYSYNGICDYYWNKLFKKSLFDGVDMSNRLPFEELRTMHKIFEKANKIKIIDEPHYYYIHRENSQSAKKPLINFFKYDARKERFFYTLANYQDKKLTELISFRLLDDFVDLVQDEPSKIWKNDLHFIRSVYKNNNSYIKLQKRLIKHLRLLFLSPQLYKAIYKIKNNQR